jgi:hypothetical protein
VHNCAGGYAMSVDKEWSVARGAVLSCTAGSSLCAGSGCTPTFGVSQTTNSESFAGGLVAG